MRTILYVILALIVSSCGIPKDKQEAMSTSLHYELSESLSKNSSVSPFELSTELKRIEKNNNTKDVYEARFSCKFKDFNDDSKYIISGVANFDKNGFVAKDENGKKRMRFIIIMKDNKSVSSEEFHNIEPKDFIK